MDRNTVFIFLVVVLVKWIYRVKCKTEERNAYGSVLDKFLVAAALTVLLERVLEATWEICTLLLVYFSLIYLFSFLNGLYSDYLKYILNLVDFSRLTPPPFKPAKEGEGRGG